MKFINLTAVILFALTFSFCAKTDKKASEMFPAYKLVVDFSKRIKPDTGLVLCCYGVNHDLPKDYPYKNSVANFTTAYALYKTQKDTISLERARELIVSLTESLLQEINSNPNVRSDLEVYPFTRELVEVILRFKDENKIELGTGVSRAYFFNGKIKYERYEIYNYTGRYPADGKNFTIHEETYAEALEIVKQRGALVHF